MSEQLQLSIEKLVEGQIAATAAMKNLAMAMRELVQQNAQLVEIILHEEQIISDETLTNYLDGTSVDFG